MFQRSSKISFSSTGPAAGNIPGEGSAGIVLQKSGSLPTGEDRRQVVTRHDTCVLLPQLQCPTTAKPTGDLLIKL